MKPSARARSSEGSFAATCSSKPLVWTLLNTLFNPRIRCLRAGRRFVCWPTVRARFSFAIAVAFVRFVRQL